jgi:hypothetical protein
MRRALAVVVAAWALSVGCGGALLREPGRQGEAVVGGVADPGDPAVVAFMAGGLQTCTGTLVGPAAVLTAGHCANALGEVPYTVAVGTDSSHPTQSVTVADQVLHPQYSGEGKPYDFAMLRLASAVVGVAPLPLATVPLTGADVGTSIRHVGFGVSDPSTGEGAGTKRQVTYPITEVDPFVVWSGAPGEQTCTGDSGGPGFITRDGAEQLAAVVSDGPDCYDAGWDGRVDVVASWIASTAAEWLPDAGPADAGEGAAHAHGSGCTSSSGAPLGALLAAGFALRRQARKRALSSGVGRRQASDLPNHP